MNFLFTRLRVGGVWCGCEWWDRENERNRLFLLAVSSSWSSSRTSQERKKKSWLSSLLSSSPSISSSRTLTVRVSTDASPWFMFCSAVNSAVDDSQWIDAGLTWLFYRCFPPALSFLIFQWSHYIQLVLCQILYVFSPMLLIIYNYIRNESFSKSIRQQINKSVSISNN